MPDPIPLNANSALLQLRRVTDQLIGNAVVVSSCSSCCGNCDGDIQNGWCSSCGTHVRVLVAYLTGRGTNDELARQAQAVFPDLPFVGFAETRNRPQFGDPYYRLALVTPPRS